MAEKNEPKNEKRVGEVNEKLEKLHIKTWKAKALNYAHI
jgi:hypothetical protein